MEPLKIYKNIPKQKELAKKLGITEAYLSQLLNGKRKTPKMLARLQALLKEQMKAA